MHTGIANHLDWQNIVANATLTNLRIVPRVRLSLGIKARSAIGYEVGSIHRESYEQDDDNDAGKIFEMKSIMHVRQIRRCA